MSNRGGERDVKDGWVDGWMSNRGGERDVKDGWMDGCEG